MIHASIIINRNCNEIYDNLDLTVASGYLNEANKRLRFNSDIGNIFVTTISDDKSLRHTVNNLLLKYMGMS